MPVVVSPSDVIKQSEAVFKQFGESKWIPFAKLNSRLKYENTHELQNVGIGKVLLLLAMGESLEENIDIIKANRDKVDIMVCDKAFGPLLDRGIKPDYVMLCDANIPYSYIKPWIDKTEGIKLISTIYGNVRWTYRWKGPKYFYVNKDAIQSERLFTKYIPLDKLRVIPAGSNVSNAMAIFFTGADEKQNINWGGYERYLLVGYDYSWRHCGNYYAFNNPVPKRHYMNHYTLIDVFGNDCFTSENLKFSARWMYSYVTSHKLPIINCSNRGLLDITNSTLKKQFSEIRGDKKTINDIRERFNMAKLAEKLSMDLKTAFHNSRRNLYIWQ